MIVLLNESNYPLYIDGRPAKGKTFEDALDEHLASGWTILALELGTAVPSERSAFEERPQWRAVLHKAND